MSTETGVSAVFNATPMLSLCMIVKNEATLLRRCLVSVVQVVDEIVVIDTGSTDSTAQVAREYGAKVVLSDWRDDFSYSRNISIEHATGKWILWLDADDVVPESTLPILTELKKQSTDRVYGFIVRNERPGGTGTEFIQARMFPNREELRFERSIHEQIMPSALRIGLQMEQCTAVIEHHGYAEPAQLRKKAARNVRMLLVEYPRVAPDTVMAIEIADSYTLIEDDDAASEWYRKVLAFPGCIDTTPVLMAHAQFGLGNIANRKQKFDEAIVHFRAAIELTPWRTDVLYSLAVAQEFAGQYAAAVQSLCTIWQIQPRAGMVGVDFRTAAIKSYLRCVRLLIELERFEDAGKVVEDACTTVGHRPEIQSMAGKYFLKTGSLLDALHAFERSLKIRREGNFEAYIGLCLIYKKAGRREVVIETLQAIDRMFLGEKRYEIAKKKIMENEISENLINSKKGDETQNTERNLLREFWGML